MLYVARAQKKAEREQILRRQFEDQRKEQMLKYQVLLVPLSSIIYIVAQSSQLSLDLYLLHAVFRLQMSM